MPGGSLARGITDVRAEGSYRSKEVHKPPLVKGVWALANGGALLSPNLPWLALLRHYEAFPGDWAADGERPPNTWRRPPGGLGGTAKGDGAGRQHRNPGAERGRRLHDQHRL